MPLRNIKPVMKNWIIFLLVATTVAFVSCEKETDEQPQSSNNRVLNTDLNNRVTYHNDPIALSGKRNNTTQFNYVAEVTSPVVKGATLSATGIAFQGNRAYVSYHWNGNDGDYAGALEVIDISNPSQPQLVSSLFFTDADLNEVYVEGNKAYIAGGRDIYASGYDQSLTNGGIVEVIDLQGGMLTTSTTQNYLPSYSGNSVFKKGNKLLVTSGNTGGGAFEVSLHPQSYLQLQDSDFYNNSKFGVEDQGKFVFLEGGPNAQLHIHSNNNFDPAGKITIPLSASTSPLNGKGVLYVDGNQVYVSGGAFGLFEFDLTNPAGTPVRNFTSGGNGFVNGVGADNEFVYAANGHDGLFILDRADFNQRAVFTFNGSANYVASNGQNVFIANGVGGLKILAKVKEEPVDPFCTNDDAYETGNWNNNKVRLTAMGKYYDPQISGPNKYGVRWRLRNESQDIRTVSLRFYGHPVFKTVTLQPGDVLHFTSHFVSSPNSFCGTLKAYDSFGTGRWHVKAHGGSVKNLDDCRGGSTGGGNIDACATGDAWNINTAVSAKVNSNETVVKKGSIMFLNDLNVEGDLYYCGSMRVVTNLLVQNGGNFDMYGSLTVDRDVNLGPNSKLIVEGALTIVGNFNFAGTIEFKGAGSSLQVFGNVNNNGGTAIGNWTGTQL